jgi:hypothetical protein
MKLNESIKNHPHGDRTRNSALRGRRLNQFDQRAINILPSKYTKYVYDMSMITQRRVQLSKHVGVRYDQL